MASFNPYNSVPHFIPVPPVQEHLNMSFIHQIPQLPPQNNVILIPNNFPGYFPSDVHLTQEDIKNLHKQILSKKDQLLAKADEVLARSPQKSQRTTVLLPPKVQKQQTEDEVFTRSSRLLGEVNSVLARAFSPQAATERHMRSSHVKVLHQRNASAVPLQNAVHYLHQAQPEQLDNHTDMIYSIHNSPISYHMSVGHTPQRTSRLERSQLAQQEKSSRSQHASASPNRNLNNRTIDCMIKLDDQVKKSRSRSPIDQSVVRDSSVPRSIRIIETTESIYRTPQRTPKLANSQFLEVQENPTIFVTPAREHECEFEDSVLLRPQPVVITTHTTPRLSPEQVIEAHVLLSAHGTPHQSPQTLRASQYVSSKQASPQRSPGSSVERRVAFADDYIKKSGFNDETVVSRPLTSSSTKTMSPPKSSASYATNATETQVKLSGILKTPKKEESRQTTSRKDYSPIVDRLGSPYQVKTKHVEETYEDGTYYKGDKFGLIRHGNGELSYLNGSKYKGEWNNNKREGYGILTLENGEVEYDGDWKDDEYDGSGILKNQKARLEERFDEKNFETLRNHWARYEGEFCKGKKHGFGTLVLLDNSKFVGHFVDGKVHGSGSFHKADGSMQIGEWENNKLIKTL